MFLSESQTVSSRSRMYLPENVTNREATDFTFTMVEEKSCITFRIPMNHCVRSGSLLSCVTAAMMARAALWKPGEREVALGLTRRTVEIPDLWSHRLTHWSHTPHSQPCRTHSTHQPLRPLAPPAPPTPSSPRFPAHIQSPARFEWISSGSRVDLESWAQFTVLSFVSVAPRGPEGASVHDIE
jgi:hypothetical protein